MKTRVCMLLVVLLVSICLPTQAIDTSQYQTLTIGSTGADVAALKQRMYELGYFKNNVINQTFTSKTAEYVKEFERINGLEVDGIADPEMQMLFYSDKALPKSAGDNLTATSEPTATPAPTATREPTAVSAVNERYPLQINNTPQPAVELLPVSPGDDVFFPEMQTGDDEGLLWQGEITIDLSAPTKTEYDFGAFKLYVPHDMTVFTLDDNGVHVVDVNADSISQADLDYAALMFQSDSTLYLVCYSLPDFSIEVRLMPVEDDYGSYPEETIRSDYLTSLQSYYEANQYTVYDTNVEYHNQTAYLTGHFSYVVNGYEWYVHQYYTTIKQDGYKSILFELLTHQTAATAEMMEVFNEFINDVVYE
jgi:peptidoglycan hydrolase-like protein with peptidoglycan-binding domain